MDGVDVDARKESEPTTPEGLGLHVKCLRTVRRLTQDELAERSGLATDTIRRLEGATQLLEQPAPRCPSPIAGLETPWRRSEASQQRAGKSE